MLAKLVEEAQEVQAASPEELVTELADVLEVFDSILAIYGLTLAQVQAIQQQRYQTRGGLKAAYSLIG